MRTRRFRRTSLTFVTGSATRSRVRWKARSPWEKAPVPTGAAPGLLDAEAGFVSVEPVDLEGVSLERPGGLQRVLLKTRFEFCGVVLRNGPDADSDIDVDITLA